MVSVSLCMIVCSEEKNLKRCLKSVKGFADEIIAVDTGSTDKSKSVLKEYGAQVFDYKWQNDFSAARNFGISKASCDYILFLDADEALELHNPSALKKYLGKNDYEIIPVRIINFYGKNPPDERRAHFSGGFRLVRNSGSVRFINKIHEKVDTAGKKVDLTSVAQRHIRILHYGYMEHAFIQKGNRNKALILQESANTDNDAWAHYYLAAENYRQGQTEQAYNEVNASILLFLKLGLKPPSLAYKLKYDLLITNHYHANAYTGIVKAITLYPDYVDLHFYKGILQYENCEYENAKKTFSYCLVLGELNLNYLILSGSGSFLALYYLGLCYQKLNLSDEAFQAFRQANSLYANLDGGLDFTHYLPSCSINKGGI